MDDVSIWETRVKTGLGVAVVLLLVFEPLLNLCVFGCPCIAAPAFVFTALPDPALDVVHLVVPLPDVAAPVPA